MCVCLPANRETTAAPWQSFWQRWASGQLCKLADFWSPSLKHKLIVNTKSSDFCLSVNSGQFIVLVSFIIDTVNHNFNGLKQHKFMNLQFCVSEWVALALNLDASSSHNILEAPAQILPLAFSDLHLCLWSYGTSSIITIVSLFLVRTDYL